MIKNLFYIVLTLTITACSSGNKTENEENVSALLPTGDNEVKAMLLTHSDFNHEIISNGTIEASRKADLTFESAEVIQRIYVKNGAFVRRGQRIAMLDQFKLRNSVQQNKDNLERAKLELQDVLIGQGYSLNDSAKIPPEVMKIANVRSNYDNNRIQYELALHNLNKSVLYAPFDGIVANLFAKEYNRANTGEAFCTIIGTSGLEVDFSVLENELTVIKLGDQVMISPFAANDYTIEGKISEINPVVDKNGMVKVKAAIQTQKNNRLYTGMNVKVRIQRYQSKQLVIPKEALVLRSNKQVVFTLKNGKAIWNYVQTGLENSSGYVILDGLHEGDSVIYEGNVNLAHETMVKTKN